jgi:hypothetical protein
MFLVHFIGGTYDMVLDWPLADINFRYNEAYTLYIKMNKPKEE